MNGGKASGNALWFTLRAWPVIAAATIFLCFLTQLVAKAFGIELPDQANIELVRKWGLHAFDSLAAFGTFAFLVAQVLVLMPTIEEFVFRGGVFRLLLRIGGKEDDAWKAHWFLGAAGVSAALFSAAHYLAQPWPDAAFVALFFFGFAQCWLYRRTRRLWTAIVNHALFNLTNLVLLFILPAA